MAAVQIWRTQGSTRNPTHTHTVISLGEIYSRLVVCTYSSFYISKLYCFFPLSLLSSHFGGSLSCLTMTHALSAHSLTLTLKRTHTHTLVVSGGSVRGCSVYCGEDVQSCRLKSLTSLVLTGGLYTILARLMCPILSSVSVHWFDTQEGCFSLPFIFPLWFFDVCCCAIKTILFSVLSANMPP